MRNPIFVALDTPSIFEAQEIIKQVAPFVGGIKLGLEFWATNGPRGVDEVVRAGHELPLFLDFKLNDIPKTVEGAMKGISLFEPLITTVHANGGRRMMEVAKESAHSFTKVVAVTVLTSLDHDDLQEQGVGDDPIEHARGLADIAKRAGLDGAVCSGNELTCIREFWPEGYFVVPGIRAAGTELNDQKRVMTPQDALSQGASVLVVGRPITAAAQPATAARAIWESISQ